MTDPISEPILATNNETVCSPLLIDAITRRVKLHHDLYNNLTIKDKYWEYTLANSFKDINISCKWDVESHDVGKDIVIESGKYKRISCKSGMISYSKRKKSITKLKISSFRTTAYATLEDKLNYIDGNHEDVVFSLSSSLFKSQNKYILTVFIPPVFKQLQWQQDKNDYKGISADVTAHIMHKCSDQLWYDIKYDSALILEKYDICLT